MGKSKMPILIALCVLLMVFMTGCFLSRRDSLADSSTGHKGRDTVEASVTTKSPSDADTSGKASGKSGSYTYIPPTYEYDDNDQNNEEGQMTANEPTKAPWTPATKMDLDPNSITVLVNKEYCLPEDYVPKDLVVPNIPFQIDGESEKKHMRREAAEAIEKLFAAALEEGHVLYGISGYRSYERQKEIFLNNIVHKGKAHTLKYSAAPGTSEHQTGLAMDVSAKSVSYKLVAAFAKSKEGKWLAENAYKFGFIIRYPKDQYEITGYAYEPWHIRYVGVDLAHYLYTNNMTMEEYYNYVPSKDFNYEEKYADLINYTPPITPTPIPEDELEEPVPIDELTGEELDEWDLDPEDDEFGDDFIDEEEAGYDLEDVNPETGSPGDDEFDNSSDETPDSGHDTGAPEDIPPDTENPGTENPDINGNSGQDDGGSDNTQGDNADETGPVAPDADTFNFLDEPLVIRND